MYTRAAVATRLRSTGSSSSYASPLLVGVGIRDLRTLEKLHWIVEYPKRPPTHTRTQISTICRLVYSCGWDYLRHQLLTPLHESIPHPASRVYHTLWMRSTEDSISIRVPRVARMSKSSMLMCSIPVQRMPPGTTLLACARRCVRSTPHA